MAKIPAHTHMNWMLGITFLTAGQGWFISPHISQPLWGTCAAGGRYQDVVSDIWSMPDLGRRMAQITPALGEEVACNYAAFLITTIVLSAACAFVMLVWGIKESFKFKTVKAFYPNTKGSYAVFAGFALSLTALCYALIFILGSTSLDLDLTSLASDGGRMKRKNTVHPDAIGWGTATDSMIISGIFLIFALGLFYTFLTIKERYYD